MIGYILPALLTALCAGSCVYCVLIAIAARKHQLAAPRSSATFQEPVSILKPLSGTDGELEANLRSFFEQDYPQFELLFAIRDVEDPALLLVRQLQGEYTHVPSQLLITGEPPYPNAKVYSLSAMTEAASYDLLLMSDSDIRVERSFVAQAVAETASHGYDVATCPYRAVPGGSLWSRLEALGMNTEFWGGVLVARLMEGVRFAVGPTVIARRKVLRAISWKELSRYLAEDFVLGQRAAELKFRVDILRTVVQHRIGSESFQRNWTHRVRWARSTRRSRPWGYAGQLFTYPIPLAILVIASRPSFWPLLLAVGCLRAWAAHVISHDLLRDPLARQEWYLIPLQDLLAFAIWLLGFVGNQIEWRGRRYRLLRDGTFEAI